MNRPTRRLILVMSVLVVVMIVFAQRYYKQQNQEVDPRIVPARELYARYNDLAVTGDYDSVFKMLDEVEAIYSGIGHYRNSFEQGVISNNRAAVWLTLGLDGATYDSTRQDSFVQLAEGAIKKSITIYELWEDQFGHADPDKCKELISDNFLAGLKHYDEEEQEKYLDNRVNEIVQSAVETRRRLSVSYTNMGIVHRFYERYDSAALCYTKALELWDRNLTAENNLNLLLGRPQRKQNIIQRLFPPER